MLYTGCKHSSTHIYPGHIQAVTRAIRVSLVSYIRLQTLTSSACSIDPAAEVSFSLLKNTKRCYVGLLTPLFPLDAAYTGPAFSLPWWYCRHRQTSPVAVGLDRRSHPPVPPTECASSPFDLPPSRGVLECCCITINRRPIQRKRENERKIRRLGLAGTANASGNTATDTPIPATVVYVYRPQ